MKAYELTMLAQTWLRARFPKAHIRRELSLAAYGGASIDVAAICEDQVVGVEIKGDGDSPSRLKLQGAMYGRICRQVYLLPSPSLVERCDKHRPPEWRMIYPPGVERISGVKCADTGIVWPADYQTQELARGKGLGLAPCALTEMVWATEIAELRMQLPDTNIRWPKQKSALVAAVGGSFPLAELEPAVCRVLRKRKWFDHNTELPATGVAA